MPTSNPLIGERWIKTPSLGYSDVTNYNEAVWIAGMSEEDPNHLIFRDAAGQRARIPLDLFLEMFEHCPNLTGRHFVNRYPEPNRSSEEGIVTRDTDTRIYFQHPNRTGGFTLSTLRFLSKYRLLPLPIDWPDYPGVDQTMPRDIWTRLLEDDND